MSVIGLDIGTSRVKAVRFDAAWQPVDAQAEDTVVLRGSDGRREQDMADVWLAAQRVLRAVIERSPDRVELVALTAQGDGCWLVDDLGEPVGPALLWNDNRATTVIDDWQRTGVLTKAFAISGCLGAPGLAHAQLRWLTEHEPARVERAATLLSCGSWVYANLTGRRVLEETEAANPFFDAIGRRYDDVLLELFGIADLRRLLPETVAGADRVAPVTAAAGRALGLAAGTPIALAPYDVPATATGTGAVGTGEAFAVLGTTLCVGAMATDPRLDREPSGMTLPGRQSQWLIAYATLMGTEVLDWAARLLAVADARAVVQLAGQSDRQDLPLLLPYLSPAGERAPFLDVSVRGSLLGLDVTHSQADIAKSVLEGLTFAVVDCLRATGSTPGSLAVCGGGARSAPWRQLIADAVGIPVVAPDVEEVGARGAALVGATDAGWFDSLPDAVAAHVRPEHTHEPDKAAVQRLVDRYGTFVTTREALRSSR